MRSRDEIAGSAAGDGGTVKGGCVQRLGVGDSIGVLGPAGDTGGAPSSGRPGAFVGHAAIVAVFSLGGLLAGCADSLDDATGPETDDAADGEIVSSSDHTDPSPSVPGPVVTSSSSETEASAPTSSTTANEQVVSEEATSTSSPKSTDGSSQGRLTHRSGLTLAYPSGWSESGAQVATEFAQDADCASAVIVDFEPPDQAGGASDEGSGETLRSFVQVCASQAGGTTLDEFMAATYGDGHGFESTTLGGREAYRRGGDIDVLMFTQTTQCRLQLVTAVDAPPELESQRAREVRDVLGSAQFTSSEGVCP